MYYQDKLENLKSIFGRQDLALEPDRLVVGDTAFPIIQDVIILSPPEQQTEFVRRTLQFDRPGPAEHQTAFAEDIQFTFGAEWTEHGRIGPDDARQLTIYLDIVETDTVLRDKRVCDLGCGSGRVSYHWKDICKELILVDFSDAIFIARKNLADANNCLFFMCDIKNLPFTSDFADCIVCLGVLHHLPTPCLDEVRRLKRYAPTLLVYLYYTLDNRAFHFRIFLRLVTLVRRCACKVRNRTFRRAFSILTALLVYKPLILLGWLLRPLGLSRYVPLYDWNHTLHFGQLTQLAYDRFFTRIEQRVSRADILELRDTFQSVVVSEQLPYWHFMCRRGAEQGAA